jgi:hypothetical protein
MAATCRVVGGPTSGTDFSLHTVTLTDSVLPGETIVLLVGHSLRITDGLVGFADVNTGPYLTIDAECSNSDNSGAGRGISCLSAYLPDGVPSGSTLRYSVKFVGGAYYHGQSPFATVLALNSGDGRYMVFDTAVSQFVLADSTPHTPTITSAADAIVLGYFAAATSVGAGWWTPDAGETEFADSAQGTESLYNVAGNYRIATSAYTGTMGGTQASGAGDYGTLAASYKAVSTEPDRGPIILAGDREGGSTTDFFASTHTAAFPFVAAASGTSTQMASRFGVENLLTLTGVKLGIYTDDAANTRPGTLIASGTVSPDPREAGIFFASVAATLVSGTKYWLAVSGSGQQVDIAGLASAAFGREGVGEMVGTWVPSGNMGVKPGIWIEKPSTVADVTLKPATLSQFDRELDPRAWF